MIDEDSKDILKEVINIGIGDAAFALSELVSYRVTIDVPELKIMKAAEIPVYARNHTTAISVYISQDFSGDIEGRMVLFYTRECSVSLLKAMGVGSQASTLADASIATLQEIGNILLVSCLSTIGNLIKGRIDFSLPQVSVDITDRYIENLTQDLKGFDSAVVVKNQMVVKEKGIDGHLFMLLGFKDFEKVIKMAERAAKTDLLTVSGEKLNNG